MWNPPSPTKPETSSRGAFGTFSSLLLSAACSLQDVCLGSSSKDKCHHNTQSESICKVGEEQDSLDEESRACATSNPDGTYHHLPFSRFPSRFPGLINNSYWSGGSAKKKKIPPRHTETGRVLRQSSERSRRRTRKKANIVPPRGGPLVLFLFYFTFFLFFFFFFFFLSFFPLLPKGFPLQGELAMRCNFDINLSSSRATPPTFLKEVCQVTKRDSFVNMSCRYQTIWGQVDDTQKDKSRNELGRNAPNPFRDRKAAMP